jgi:hypothetical protein
MQQSAYAILDVFFSWHKEECESICSTTVPSYYVSEFLTSLLKGCAKVQ